MVGKNTTAPEVASAIPRVIPLAAGVQVWVKDDAEVYKPGEVLRVLPTKSAKPTNKNTLTRSNLTSSTAFSPRSRVASSGTNALSSSPARNGISTKPDEGVVEVRVGSQTMELLPSQLLLRNELKMQPDGIKTVENVDQLPFLHEAALLHTLQTRLHQDLTYTYAGNVLLSVLSKSSKTHTGYEEMSNYIRDNTRECANSKPHIFGLAMEAFYSMYNKGVSQMVMFSGEQGSGKTENAKAVLRCLTSLKPSAVEQAAAGATATTTSVMVSPVITPSMTSSANTKRTAAVTALHEAVEPLLEAFGNAYTVRNRNGSCFGSLTELFYNMNNRSQLVGGKMETLFFQKARVTELNQGERNFHIFYQYTSALQASAKDNYRYHFKDSTSNSCVYKFVPFEGVKKAVLPKMLSQGGLVKVNDVDDAADFDVTLHALHCLGITVAEQESMFQILTVIVLLSCVASDAPGVLGPAKKVDERAVEMRLGVLGRILGLRDLPKLAHVCNNSGAIHALGRLLYQQLWDFILQKANEVLLQDRVEVESNPTDFASVSVLDMFGFESFKKNSFEQFCTNFSTEVLNKYIFQDVYAKERLFQTREGLPVAVLPPQKLHQDHAEAVNLIRTGVFPVLEALQNDGKFAAGMAEKERMLKLDKLFCQRLRTQFGAGKNPRFMEKRQQTDTFAIKHFTAEVAYAAAGFSWKNQDPYTAELYQFLKEESENPFLQNLLQNNSAKLLQPATKLLRTQVDRVMRLVEGSERHFCICLKPSNKRESNSDLFARPYVAEQLRMQGVLEIVKLKRGMNKYKVRVGRAQFLKDYGGLVPKRILNEFMSSDSTTQSVEHASRQFFNTVAEKHSVVKDAIKADGENFIGSSTAFLTEPMYRALRKITSGLNDQAITKLCARWRGALTRRRYVFIRKSIVRIQRYVREYMTLKTKRKFQHLIWLLHEKGDKPKGLMAMARQMKADKEAASGEKPELPAHVVEKQEAAGERARLQQQKLDLMHHLQRLKESSEIAVPFSFYIEGDEIVDNDGTNRQSEQSMVKQLYAVQQQMADAIGSSGDGRMRQCWDRMQGVLQRLVLDVEGGPKRTQYLLEKQERDWKRMMENDREHFLEVVKHKLGGIVDLTPEEAKRRARQSITNIDIEFSVSKLKKDLAEITDGVSDEERAKLHTEEQFRHFNFDELSPIWTERLVRNLRRTKKPLDVLIIGPKNVGKTELVRRMYKTCMMPMPPAFLNPKTGEEYTFATLGGRAENSIREDPEHFLPDLVRHDMDFGGGFNLRILDCHARLSESSLYRNLYGQAHWVFIVYTVTRQESLTSALSLLKEAKKFNNNVMLLGNLIFEAETVKATSRSAQRRVASESREVNLNYVKARADKHQGICMETSDLLVATKLAVESMMAPSEVVQYVPSLKEAWELSVQSPPAQRREEMRSVDDAYKKDIRERLQGVKDTTPSLEEHEAENSYVRYPIAEAYDYGFMSLIPPKEDVAHKELLQKAHDRTEKQKRLNYHDDAEGMNKLNKDYEEEDYDAGQDRDLILVEKRKPKVPSAVTCIQFGLENRVKTFSFLVVGYKDGHLALYRMNHTQTDYELIHMASEQEVGVEETTDYMRLVQATSKQVNKDQGLFTHVSTWKAHQSAITSVVFTSTEQRLISTSTDRTMRMWNLETGHDHFVQHGHPHLQFAAEDAYPISCVATIPAFPQLYVLANASGNLRVGDYLAGSIIQKFSHNEEIRCLQIDHRQGNYMFGGTKYGEVFVIDCERPTDFKFLPNLSIRLNQHWQGCTDMKFGSLQTIGSQPEYSKENEFGWQDLLVVNCADNSVVTLQVTFERDYNRILTMTVLHRYPNLQTVLPLKSCFSNHGYILTAGEDRHVHVHTIHNPRHVCSLLHDEPTVAVDLNRSHTILASGDVEGNIYIWRCYEKPGDSSDDLEPNSGDFEPGSQGTEGSEYARGPSMRKSRGSDSMSVGVKGGDGMASMRQQGFGSAAEAVDDDSDMPAGNFRNSASMNEPGTMGAPAFGRVASGSVSGGNKSSTTKKSSGSSSSSSG
ncbi:unnamed protein product [Amoebophrya sp. A120]|nr:unnamed protein product [Amoebophrya sp. A120]|eukprot:GSA120T00023302001.1